MLKVVLLCFIFFRLGKMATKADPAALYQGVGGTDAGATYIEMTNGRPRSRSDTHWWYIDSYLFIFSGTQNAGFYADVWRYNSAVSQTNRWYLWKGQSQNQALTIGDISDYHVVNTPGHRYGGAFTTVEKFNTGDNPTKIMFFVGGHQRNAGGDMNDVWLFHIQINDWRPLYVPQPLVVDDTAYYSQQGVFNASNKISSSVFAVIVDMRDVLVYFGGKRSGDNYLNSVWHYNTTCLQWGFFKGDPINGKNSVSNPFPGQYNAGNHPLGRSNHIMFKASSTEVIIFGGRCQNSVTDSFCNDGWLYDYVLNEFKHVGGDIDIPGGLGSAIMGDRTYHPSNWPSSREHMSYIFLHGSTNEMLVYGGMGYSMDGGFGYLSDWWLYKIDSNEWLFWGGSKNANATSRYESGFNNKFRSYNNLGGASNHVMHWVASSSPLPYGIFTKDLYTLFGPEFFGPSPPQFFTNRFWQVNLYDPKYCYTKWSNESACGYPEQGTCIGLNSCECDPKYYANDCSNPTCYGLRLNENPCRNRGDCISADNCECDRNGTDILYYGHDCRYETCMNGNDTNTCSDHGKCSYPNECTCDDGYYGHDCGYKVCMNGNENNTCSDHGTCAYPNNCTCDDGYYGEECEKWYCYGKMMEDVDVCNGGSCTSYDTCDCKNKNPKWFMKLDKDCKEKEDSELITLTVVIGSSVGVVVIVVLLLIVIIIVVIVVCCMVKMKGKRKGEKDDGNVDKELSIVDDEKTKKDEKKEEKKEEKEEKKEKKEEKKEEKEGKKEEKQEKEEKKEGKKEEEEKKEVEKEE